jgi:hypothetical protein
MKFLIENAFHYEIFEMAKLFAAKYQDPEMQTCLFISLLHNAAKPGTACPAGAM